MAKDRFSKFKKSNYSSDFRYGHNTMNHVGVGKRDKLNDTQRQWIVNLIQKINFEPSKKYLRSILADGKVPTQKQKTIIKQIITQNRI